MTGNMERAADELMRAYMDLYDEAWLDEDPKYLDFLATVDKGLKTTAGKTVSYDADCLTCFSDGLNLGPYGEYWFFAENSECPRRLIANIGRSFRPYRSG